MLMASINLQEAVSFFRLIGRDPKNIIYQAFKDKHFDYASVGQAIPKPRTMRNSDELKAAASENCGIYWTLAKFDQLPIGRISRSKDSIRQHGGKMDCFVIEWDDISKEEQLERIDQSGFPTPSIRIDSGGKSIHQYWFIDQDIDPDEWEKIQSRFVSVFQADLSIKSLDQVMRLPGAEHISGGTSTKVLAAEKDVDSDFNVIVKRYTLEQFLEALGDYEEKNKPATSPATLQQLAVQPQEIPVGDKTGASRWFDLLAAQEQEACVVEMLKKISDVHGIASEGGYVPNQLQEKFLFGVFSHFKNKSDADMVALIEKAYTWASDSHKLEDGTFGAWRISLLRAALQKRQNIGSTIRFARSCGWDPKPWKEVAGKDDQSLAAIVIDDLFDLNDDNSRDVLTIMGRTYWRRNGNFHYDELPKHELTNMVSQFIYDNYPKKFGAVDQIIKSLQQFTARPARVAPDGYINFTNGVLHVKGGKRVLYPHFSPETLDMVFLDAPACKYDPNADRTYARQVLEGLENEEAREIWLRIVAQGVNNAEAQQHLMPVALINFGKGGNGKDVCINLVQYIFGKSLVSRIDLADLAKASDPSQNNGTLALLPLQHSRFNLPSETPTTKKLNHLSDFKACVTNDEMKARGHNDDFVYFHPRAVHMLSVNEGLLIDQTDAMARRFRAVNWPYVYKSESDYDKHNQFHRKAVLWFKPNARDVEGVQRVKDEICPGFILEILDAYDRLCGFMESDYGKGVPRKYSDSVFRNLRGETDHVLRFLEESGYYKSEEEWSSTTISVTGLYEEYLRWGVPEGYTQYAVPEAALLSNELPKIVRNSGAIESANKLERRVLAAMNGVESVRMNQVTANNHGIPRTKSYKYLARRTDG